MSQRNTTGVAPFCASCSCPHNLVTCASCATKFCRNKSSGDETACVTFTTDDTDEEDEFLCPRCHVDERPGQLLTYTFLPRRTRYGVEPRAECEHKELQTRGAGCIGLHLDVVVSNEFEEKAKYFAQAFRGRWEAQWPLSIRITSFSNQSRARALTHEECTPEKEILASCRVLLVVMMNPDHESNTILPGMDISKFLKTGLPNRITTRLASNKREAACVLLVPTSARNRRNSVGELYINFIKTLNFSWIVHYQQRVSRPQELFGCVQSFAVDALGHNRDLKHAVITNWVMDPPARANTDIVLYHPSEQPTHLRWAHFPDRPWGSEPLTTCDCSEPDTSRGAERAWIWDPLSKGQLVKASEVHVTCTWCGSRVTWLRPQGIPALQLVGDTGFVEYGFPRVEIVFEDAPKTSGGI
ncbi:hypothetical protein BDV93DRAFT_611467 [Ceratobasidium sp. AG-I]|nr:hypothetical protein BDV93DRAFT_611467 [Ceratobasidium sp. AG-I]